MNKIKNIISEIAGMLIIFFIVGGIPYLIISSHKEEVEKKHKEEIKKEEIQQEEKLEIENKIKKIATKWNAITNWEERFDKKIENVELITTVDFQNNLINDKNRPILAFGAILDIERKSNNIYLVTAEDTLKFNLNARFVINLSSEQYENIIKCPIDKYSLERFAFIMSVQRIESPQFPTAPQYFERSNFVITIYGDCLEIIFVGDYDVK